MGDRGAGGGLGQGGQVVRQPDQPQRVGDRRVGGQVAQPGTGEGEGLAHRAGHDQPRPPGQQLERAGRPGPGELRVGLVDHHHRVVARGVDRLDDVQPERRAGRVVRRAEEHHVGVGVAHLLGRRVRAPGRSHPRRGVTAARAPSAQAVPVTWAIRGCIEYAGVKPSARRPGPPKAWSSCCSTSLEPFAAQTWSGSTGAAGGRPQVAGQRLAQRGELAVGVAVEVLHLTGDGLDDGERHVLRHVVGVLVGVQPHRDVELRRAVRGGPPQVLAQRQLGGHRASLGSRLARTVGRTSAWPVSARPSGRAEPGPHRGTVGRQVLGVGQGADVVGHLAQGRLVVVDDVDAAQEGLHRQPAGVPGAAAGRAGRGSTRRSSRRATPARTRPTKTAPALRTRAARSRASRVWISRCSAA